MKLRSALLAATVLAMPFAASAQPVTGLYVGGGAGVNITTQESLKNLSSSTLAPLGTGIALTGNLQGSTGFAGELSVGWGFGNGLRAEIEGDYLYNHISGVTGGASSGIGGGTNEQKFGGFANVLYDFNGLTPWMVPYVGVGVGAQGVAEKYHFYNTNTFAGPGTSVFGPGGVNLNGQTTTGSFAYQAIVGVAFPLNNVIPGLALTTEYRFMGTTGNRSYAGTATAVTTKGFAGSAPATLSLGPTYNNEVLIGLRYNFGVAPPPPPPAPAAAPAPAPARSYLVFFDWDKATLTDRARQIIGEAAANSTKVQYTRIEVNGYTDTSGTPRYNQGLSVRRAQAVAAELVKDGVPKAAISIQGFGDTHLLVPTGPGVREPQNRRVEIIIR
jgi:outer membrane protein OmpA-like peptidoglycan-associated protein